MAKASDPASILHNTITAGTDIVGDIKSQGDIRLDGTLKGTLEIKGRLVVGQTGKIEGTISCSSAEISGTVVGKIFVSELLSFTETADIQGDIVVNKLNIQPGCRFSGSCSMDTSRNPSENLE